MKLGRNFVFIALLATSSIAFAIGGANPNPSPDPLPPADGSWENPYRADNCALASSGQPVECPYSPFQQGAESVKYFFKVVESKFNAAWWDPVSIGGFLIETSDGIITRIGAPKAPNGQPSTEPGVMALRGVGLQLNDDYGVSMGIVALEWDQWIDLPVSSFSVLPFSAANNSDFLLDPGTYCFSCDSLPSSFALNLTFAGVDPQPAAKSFTTATEVVVNMTWTSFLLGPQQVPEPGAISLAGVAFALLAFTGRRNTRLLR